jgi:hypothetical protein
MEHGEVRNRRTETETEYTTYQAPGGDIVLPSFSKTETVSERWCETCQEWVTAKGIIGALLCPKCNGLWSE